MIIKKLKKSMIVYSADLFEPSHISFSDLSLLVSPAHW